MINIKPIHLLTSNHVLAHGANQAKHVQGVPHPEGVHPAQLPFSAAPPLQGRYARGSDGRGRDFYAGQHVRIRSPDGRYFPGQVAYLARYFDKAVFVWVGGGKMTVTNDPEFIIPTQ